MRKKSMDGNTAAANIAYAFSEVTAIYPITPSTGMSEIIDEWAASLRKNLFDQKVEVVEMQSEAGAAGAVHGILSAGGFSSTFTASQGLLLMIPNMYKIAGELLPVVFHVSARALAGQALSIFGDHQDVMATRSTGFCMLASSSVQEVMDLALVAHLATLRASLPFLHFFDGFRTSHEIQKIDEISYEEIAPLVDWEAVERHRKQALNSEHPYLKGSDQNPDIYFQVNEASNPFYLKVPKIVEEEMEKVFQLTKRRYHLFDYVGHPEAERVIVLMGSGAEATEETVRFLWQKKGEKVGVVKVRLYRPFSVEHFFAALPPSVKKIAVLDRTKESAALGEPLYLDVAAAFQSKKPSPLIVGGRYGLGSKDFTPAMVHAVFDNLNLPEPKNHFTVGIVDDVTETSLWVGEALETESEGVIRCKFWGLGGDGTIGANKDAIKIIGDNTDKYVQGYFTYDAKKTSGVTVSHLRFGKEPIHSTYLLQVADYVACHHPSYVKKYDLLEGIREGGTFVLNAPWGLKEIEVQFPASLKRAIAQKKLSFYVIDAASLAREIGLQGHINMIMQTVFFKLSEVLPLEKAITLLKGAIAKSYAKKGEKVIAMNQKAVDLTLEKLNKIDYPSSWALLPLEKEEEDLLLPEFIRKVADVVNAQKGDLLPVSAFVPGGVFPLSTTKYEKRDIAVELPEWLPEFCIQCNQCSFVCPHAAIRPFLLTPEEAKKAPEGYVGLKPAGLKEEFLYSIVVSPMDCTGCRNCAEICPALKSKALVMRKKEEVKEKEKKLWDYVSSLPYHTTTLSKFSVKGSQFQLPLLEFSGACAGCGETPYVKLLTQLFGTRMLISNATGCSSIWGGTAPSIPWTVTAEGKGPAWANSLFEDNAEHGLGIFLGMEKRREKLVEWVEKAKEESQEPKTQEVFQEWLKSKEEGEKSVAPSKKIEELLQPMKKRTSALEEVWKRKDLLVKPSVWIVGGDGWAYDIGFGGLDHVLSLGRDVNVLVLDTELYSNTGGQASKATPLGAVAKFASLGKRTMKKDLGLMAMSYGNVYVASVCIGADKAQVVRAMKEAESYPGPSLIIAYSTCISHGIRGGLSKGWEEGKRVVDSGYWINYRFDPRLKLEGKSPLILDSKEPTLSLKEFLLGEARYNFLHKTKPEEAQKLLQELEEGLKKRRLFYENLAKVL